LTRRLTASIYEWYKRKCPAIAGHFLSLLCSLKIDAYLYYFFLARTTCSIPIPPKVIETTTPPKKITIGTKSSIGIAHPLHFVIWKKYKTTNPQLLLLLGASLAETFHSCNFLYVACMWLVCGSYLIDVHYVTLMGHNIAVAARFLIKLKIPAVNIQPKFGNLVLTAIFYGFEADCGSTGNKTT
jgi:hypothetical protein